MSVDFNRDPPLQLHGCLMILIAIHSCDHRMSDDFNRDPLLQLQCDHRMPVDFNRDPTNIYISFHLYLKNHQLC